MDLQLELDYLRMNVGDIRCRMIVWTFLLGYVAEGIMRSRLRERIETRECEAEGCGGDGDGDCGCDGASVGRHIYALPQRYDPG